MKTEMFPLVIEANGVRSIIRRASQVQNGRIYESYIVEFFLLGKRKRVRRTDIDEAKAIAREACIKISNGDQSALELRNGERLAYTRAVEILAPSGIPIDSAAREVADALAILGGKASIAEACREWVKRNAVVLPKITVEAAAQALQRQAITDGKSKDRQKQLSAGLDALAAAFNVEVHTITPNLISRYLAALPFVERTRRNHRDTIGFFNRWLVLRGYLTKGTDWLEGVQKYSARKLSEIEIYTAPEIVRLLRDAGDMTPFISIAAFAGLRHAEIARLDWREIDLEDGFIEVCAAKSKTGERRLVPIHSNLKKWLLPRRPKSGEGKVVPYANATKQLLKIAKATGRAVTASMPEVPAVVWKRNGLRHSFVSHRVAECSNVPLVSDEAGNSPAIVRQHYLRRVKPAAAAEWFSVSPPRMSAKRKPVVS